MGCGQGELMYGVWSRGANVSGGVAKGSQCMGCGMCTLQKKSMKPYMYMYMYMYG